MTIPSQPRSLVVFDLDGTLLDSLQDLTLCCNQALAQCGHPTHPTASYAVFVGNGADMLLHRALPEGHSQQQWEQLKETYMPIYLALCKEGGTLFDGTLELLHTLRGMGVLTAAVSNKPQEHTCAVCKALFDGTLDGWLGDHPEVPLKPDPAGVRLMEQQLDAKCVAFVGDSTVDVETAHNCGIPAIAVSWGMQPREKLVGANPEYLADDFTALKQFLLDILSK